MPGAKPGTEDMATDRAPSLPVVKKSPVGASLVVQWLRLCLPMQGTPVRSLVREVRSHVPRGQLSPCATAREKPNAHRPTIPGSQIHNKQIYEKSPQWSLSSAPGPCTHVHLLVSALCGRDALCRQDALCGWDALSCCSHGHSIVDTY